MLGWQLSAIDEVPPAGDQVRCVDDSAARLRHVSTFEHLTEDEIREGFADIATAVAENPDQAFEPLPVDLLVFTNVPNRSTFP